MKRRGGWALIEMTIVVLLVGVFMALSMRLFRTSMDVITGGSRHAATVRRLDRAVEALRADAWGAYELRVVETNALVIRPTGDHTIVWKFDDAADRIQRGVFEGEQRLESASWDLHGELRFDADGSIVTLTWTDTTGRTRRWPLYSQLRMLIGGGS